MIIRARYENTEHTSKTSLLWIWTFLMIAIFWPVTSYAWEKVDPEKTPRKEAFPQSDAVIIKDEAIMEIKSTGEGRFTFHRLMKVFSDPDKRYSHQEIPFNDKIKVIKIKARTIHSDGDQFFLNEEEIREKSLLSDYVLYSDAKILEFYFPRVDTNCLLEYEYQLLFTSLLYWGDWFFQSHLPTLSSKYTLIVPKDFGFKVKVLNDLIEPQIDFAKGKKVFVWETFNRAPINQEHFMPPAADLASRLAFSPEKFRFDDRVYPSRDWDDIARWYWEISQPSMIPNQKLKQLATELTSGLDSTRKKIKAIFQFIQDHIRYIAIAIGTGAFRPHPCEDILEYGYGDCKDMTALLITLLKTIDTPAYPALLSTKGHRSLLTDLPKVKQFDHVVVALPSNDGYIWLDPACRDCKFGQLPFEDQKTYALVVKPDGGELILTSQTEEDKNVTHTFWEIKLNSDGSVLGNLKIESTGQEELAFRASLSKLKPQRKRKALSEFLSSWFVNPYLVEYAFRNFEERDSNIFIQASFVAEGFGAKQQDLLLVGVDLSTQRYLRFLFPQKKRNFPIIFDYKFINIDETKLVIPPQLQIEHLPKDVHLDKPWGRFESTYQIEGDQIIHKRVFLRKRLNFSKDEYAELKDFYDLAAQADAQKIILRKKSSTRKKNK